MKPKATSLDPAVDDRISRAAALLRVPLPDSEPALSVEIARRADVVAVMLGFAPDVVEDHQDEGKEGDPPKCAAAG